MCLICYLIPHYPVCSEDLGRSWIRHGQILTVGTRPVTPAWAGIGDFDIVWDWQHERWFLLASHLRGAVSYDRSATGASWRKWDGEAFTRDNLGQDAERFRDVRNRTLPNGEHPSIHWNRLLGQH